jgi:hypothetical protein
VSRVASSEKIRHGWVAKCIITEQKIHPQSL